MMNTDNLISRIKTTLDSGYVPLGLLYGKMGLCVFFYRLGRKGGDTEYGKLAGRFLDEVFKNITTIRTIDIENGLSGIGLGISYLIRNGYVDGDENEILRDVDDEIFKQISFPNEVSENVTTIIQILFYIYVRKQSLKGEQEYLFNELAIHIINTLHIKVDKILDDDAIAFNLRSSLPLFLFALSKIYETGIYNHKIERIMREITSFILSKYGYLDSKKLYLLWGISKINKHINDERLTEYYRSLASGIDVDRLVGEFRNKNIFIEKGLAGVCLLMLTLDDEARRYIEIDKFLAATKVRIENSLVWESPDNQPIGLSGYCGVMSVYDTIMQRV